MVQKLMLYGMPLGLFVSGFFFPIGVLLYWFTNNLWTLGQQFYILRKMPPPGSPAAKAKAAATSRPSTRRRWRPSPAPSRSAPRPVVRPPPACRRAPTTAAHGRDAHGRDVRRLGGRCATPRPAMHRRPAGCHRANGAASPTGEWIGPRPPASAGRAGRAAPAPANRASASAADRARDARARRPAGAAGHRPPGPTRPPLRTGGTPVSAPQQPSDPREAAVATDRARPPRPRPKPPCPRRPTGRRTTPVHRPARRRPGERRRRRRARGRPRRTRLDEATMGRRRSTTCSSARATSPATTSSGCSTSSTSTGTSTSTWRATGPRWPSSAAGWAT